MRKPVVLDEIEWGQIIDGLSFMADRYEETGCYYETGVAEHEILEVRDADEAQNLAQLYRSIICKIEKGLAKHKLD